MVVIFTVVLQNSVACDNKVATGAKLDGKFNIVLLVRKNSIDKVPRTWKQAKTKRIKYEREPYIFTGGATHSAIAQVPHGEATMLGTTIFSRDGVCPS